MITGKDFIDYIDEERMFSEILEEEEQRMFDDNNNIVQIYCDVTDGNVLGDDPYFDDLFIDIVLYNDNVFMIDQDDLINAYREGVITTLQYNKAKVASLRLYDFVKDNKKEIIDYCYRMLNELSEE